MKRDYDIIVVGGGPAGMAAAVAAYDQGVTNVVVLDREEEAGGILRQCIHSGFGLHALGEELTGPEYAAVYREMVKERGIPVLSETTALSIEDPLSVTVTSREGVRTLRGGAIVLAMGCRERSIGALRIAGSRPAGIFSAGTAQKWINCHGVLVGKKVVILGSGDIGLIMARRMTLEGAEVVAVCERLPYSGGLKRNITQCLEDYGIPLYLSCTVTQIHGTERLTGVTLSNVDEKGTPIAGTERFVSCDTLLLSVGLIPENELSRGAGIPLSTVTSGPLVDENRMTQKEGIFACGNVLQVHDLVDFVSEEAALAGRSAADFVLGRLSRGEALSVEAGEGIRYVVPQRICGEKEEEISLYFRVKEPQKNVHLCVYAGERCLKRVSRLAVAPGEMERISLRIPQEIKKEKGEIRVVLEERV